MTVFMLIILLQVFTCFKVIKVAVQLVSKTVILIAWLELSLLQWTTELAYLTEDTVIGTIGPIDYFPPEYEN